MNIMLLISKLESSRGKVISLNAINMSSTHSNKRCGLNIFTKVGKGMKNIHRDFLYYVIWLNSMETRDCLLLYIRILIL